MVSNFVWISNSWLKVSLTVHSAQISDPSPLLWFQLLYIVSKGPISSLLGEANPYLQYHMLVSERQLCQRNIHITICSSNTAVLWQVLLLKGFVFNCSQSILRYNLNVKRDIFFLSSHSPRSGLRPDGIEDQWVGTARRVQCSGCYCAIESETRTLGTMLVAAVCSWISKSFRNQQCEPGYQV